MKFEKFDDYSGQSVTIEISNESNLDEVFEAFTLFLRASGYTIPYDKQIELVDVDE